jgi:hypothetical protein
MKNPPIIWNRLFSGLARTIFISLALELKDEIQFEIREKVTGRVHSIHHPPLSAIPTQQQLTYIKLIPTGSRFPALPPRIQFPIYWNSNYRS